jgi:type IV pilus assembly protein PilB
MDEPIDLFRGHIPQHVIGLIPSSVARENLAIPIYDNEGALIVAMADPDNFDFVEKLRFVLQRDILPRRASVSAIKFALSRYYAE